MHPAPGTLLLAPPMMADPNFRRTAILLCDHGIDGSFGLVLNRPMALQVAAVIEGLGTYRDPLSLGGPVQTDTVHYLHRYGTALSDAIEVLPGVFWGGDFEELVGVAASEPVSAQTLRFFLGYAGWSPGQLQEEIDDDGWILCPGSEDLIFPDDAERTWRDALRRMGGEYALLANFPDDPRLN